MRRGALRFALYAAIVAAGVLLGLFGLSQPAHASTYVVNSFGDDPDTTPGDDSCDDLNGRCSLRAAIQEANAHAGPDIINFNIPSGLRTIVLGSALPAITEGVTINGFTQPGASPNTLAVGDDATILIEIDVSGQGNGLVIQSSGVTIRGLSIGGATGALDAGVLVEGGADAQIVGARIGLRADGATARANTRGVVVADPAAATIGGTTPGDRNTISGNTFAGVDVQTTAPGVAILNSYIGTNAGGTAARDNGSDNIRIVSEAQGVRVGTPGAGNLISGAPSFGLFVVCSPCLASPSVIVQANVIGADATGTAAIPNASGILIFLGAGVVIGTDADGTNDAAEGNVISGNTGWGVRWQGVNTPTPGSARIAGNKIGTDAAGAVALPNGSGGILWDIVDQGASAIGGPSAAARNVISGNTGPGIQIEHAVAADIVGDLTIQNNLIGTNAAGTGPLPNTGPGIQVITGETRRVRIGGTGTTDGNTIRHNGGAGVAVTAGVDISIRGNSIDQNGGLGIDLGAAGVTANDGGDGDGGANNLQNFPLVARASTDGATTSVIGTLDSAAGGYDIDFYGSSTCDGFGNGEGAVYLGRSTITVPGGAFTVTGLAATTVGHVVTATVTRQTAPHDTSEFSACRVITPPPNVTVTQSDGTNAVAEGGATDTLLLALTVQPTADVTVAFTTGAQLQPTPSITFTTANWNVPQVITVAAVDDLLTEGAHNASLAFAVSSADAGYNGLAVPSVTVSIADNDAAGFVVTPTSGLQTTEAGGAATFTVRLASVPSASVTITLTSSDATEGAVAPASLTFVADATAVSPQTVTVTGQDDAIVDGAVTYTIMLGAAVSADPAYSGQDPPDVSVTNWDNETGAGLRVDDPPAVTEGDAGSVTLTFTLTLSPASAATVTVPFSTANGSATGGGACGSSIDYLTTSGAVTFAPGDTSKTITVTVCGDTIAEGNETLLVNLGAPTGGAILADGQATGTIRDDDTGGVISFDPTAASVGEGDRATLTVRRGGGMASGVTVQFATADGAATAGRDYDATGGTLTFGANETTRTITVPILADADVEAAETFTVTLSNPSGGASLGPARVATVSIVDAPLGTQPSGGEDPDPGTKNARESRDRRETEGEKQQRERTNRSNRDDYATEGNVVEVHQDEQPPYVIIGNRDGLVRVNLLCGAACPTIRVGDYLEADGEKEHEALFNATDVTVRR